MGTLKNVGSNLNADRACAIAAAICRLPDQALQWRRPGPRNPVVRQFVRTGTGTRSLYPPADAENQRTDRAAIIIEAKVGAGGAIALQCLWCSE